MSRSHTQTQSWDLAVRPTPLHARTAQFNRTNQWTQELGWTLPSVYDHLEAEHAALRNACALSDLNGLVTYQLSGREVSEYLNRLAGGCGGDVGVGKCRRVAISDDEGGLIADGVVIRSDQSGWLLTLPVRCLDWLITSAHGFDCYVQDVSETTSTFALDGPSSCAALLAAGMGGIEALRPGAVRALTVGTAKVTVARISATGGLGYEVRCDTDDAVFVFDRVRLGAELFRPVFAGQHARHLAQLEAGHPRANHDFESALTASLDDRRSAFEVGLGALLDFSGGHFTGKHALMRQREKGAQRAIVGVEVDGELQPDGRLISTPTGIVGKVTSHAWSPSCKKQIGLADLRADILGSAADISLQGQAGQKIPVKIAPRPFYTCPNARRTPPEAQ
ncbi:Aminomethyltransferase (glycine cleavage system T protein) [Candidatus Phaeomarinobacter ectocarpi]|uniref:Aminomethyltransferase (Glycine cleavage system T protein) n=1 Tax=Candidatus Phaeomarinibacter ectocarpi TaxID=1458461 RepID=X5MGQ5_9HYPH|nr:glycine cleavage T C-terminal barrel domain-containing protein [Candidatus Phaeomarinobacter ectocarpi]CDO60709.1 Aminomethyltransferase (glycine cleavage system T protein) [Candidatus Phaeomarinobacter ectocarpi]